MSDDTSMKEHSNDAFDFLTLRGRVRAVTIQRFPIRSLRRRCENKMCL
ncbi:MAG: hypothetical protein LKK11_05140 [Acidaminococcus sp.]|jgi:hypothetical protein|nr:hypothetical protein [Acidaminococcus sp.]